MKKNIITAILSAIIFILGAAMANAEPTSLSGNVKGWLWGGSEDNDFVFYCSLINFAKFPPASMPLICEEGKIDGNESGVGWTSMSSSNCDADGDGKSDGTGFCPVAGFVMGNYGINIPKATCIGSECDLSGYVWNENLGWISFQENSGFPAVSSGDNHAHKPRRDGNSLTGWARILSIPQSIGANGALNSGGWEGWIRLHSDDDDNIKYGIGISNNNMSGYAWSDELGWIDFSGAKIDCNPTYSDYVCKKDNELDCTTPGNCGKDKYYVTCVAKNDCSGETESRDISECVAAGEDCTVAAGECPTCPGAAGGSNSPYKGWKEVSPY